MPDLDAAGRAFVRLGFNVMDRSPLLKPGPDGRDVPSGAENRVVMFPRGYQELIQITDPSLGHVIVPRLHRYWGIHILVFSVSDAGAEHRRITDRGIAVTPLTTWTRPVRGDTARFTFFLVDDRDAPEATLCFVEHETPELVRPAGSTSHPNGIAGLVGAYVCVGDRDEALARYERILGVSPADGSRFVFADQTWLRLVEHAEMSTAFPGEHIPSAPSVAAVQYAFADPDAIRGAVREAGDRKWIAPADAAGALIVIGGSG